MHTPTNMPDAGLIQDEDGLWTNNYMPYVCYKEGSTTICLDGEFSAEHLAALIAFMARTKGVDNGPTTQV